MRYSQQISLRVRAPVVTSHQTYWFQCAWIVTTHKQCNGVVQLYTCRLSWQPSESMDIYRFEIYRMFGYIIFWELKVMWYYSVDKKSINYISLPWFIGWRKPENSALHLGSLRVLFVNFYPKRKPLRRILKWKKLAVILAIVVDLNNTKIHVKHHLENNLSFLWSICIFFCIIAKLTKLTSNARNDAQSLVLSKRITRHPRYSTVLKQKELTKGSSSHYLVM